ncbi:hypothetical protein A2215_03895 [Candidatus Berkelbacteria bacterium RIFOXYA2_FULL_43_10]|uniref:Conjugal transfer protein TrbL n=1 Tax=Candidatus Berkelbacteria bacterium RIFOXYA2_FULL_43_10 TaxID=1797472 RepID=A0A1F5E458_9BACT|nr:MAG: hypothetical protein A2215_03895 [Candidatus Berkelbacteria bacterium RIFOXYA2_FULL_43_10]
MKKLLYTIGIIIPLFLPRIAFAASNTEVDKFAGDAMTAILALAGTAAVFFLIRGGYLYMTSSGDPTALDDAKRTIRNAIIGLVIVIAAGFLANLLDQSLTQSSSGGSATALQLSPIEPQQQTGTLTQILLDAVSGFLQNIVGSVTKPILNGIIWFLTSTPSLSTNSVVFNFWLIIVGITDSLFAVAIALIGFRVMSASSFGMEDIPLKELLPKIGLAFLLANTSIFWIDWIIELCQTMVNAVLSATGGLSNAWIINAFDPAALLTGTTALVTLIFAIIFILLAVVLLIFYISRLMILAFGAVISPLVCLLSLSPKMADFVGNAIKIYVVTIFTVFLHVVIIQLASSFLTVPGQVGENPIIGILVGVALFSVLLKSTSVTVQLAMSSQAGNTLKKFSTQVINVISANSGKTKQAAETASKLARAK